MISTTLQSHHVMILQNRLALHYILGKQGCTVVVAQNVIKTHLTLLLGQYIKDLHNCVIHIDQVYSDGMGA